MKSIYRSQEAKEAVIALYEKQLSELNIDYKDVFVETSFGKTHLIDAEILISSRCLSFTAATQPLPII